MKYISTRSFANPLSFSDALQRGLADDGGLFVPERFPHFEPGEFEGFDALPAIAMKLLAPFLEGDVLQARLPGLCTNAFDFPIPLKELDAGKTAVLELFHGPTAAFKDVGARFLAECLTTIREQAGNPLWIVVATSGDTGGAVAAAFFRKPRIKVVILFPKGKVSRIQEHQLTCWGENVRAFAVRGTFDDCQALAKEVLSHREFRKNHEVTSANSISIGRLLPQMVYYAASSLEYFHNHRVKPGYVIPTGNLGNAVACFWARKCGLPIGEIVLATNANKTLSDFSATGEWKPRGSIATLANAMDVGNPSNMERLLHLYTSYESIRREVRAFSVGDAQIEKAIVAGRTQWKQIWCPHTATAVHVRQLLSKGHWILVSTAHAAKFQSVVEPLVKTAVPLPDSLKGLLSRTASVEEVDADLGSLLALLKRSET